MDVDVPWVSATDRRAVLDHLRRARERLDRLERARPKARVADPDLSREVRWFVWRQAVRRATAAAELEVWQHIHQQIEAWQDD